MNIREKCEKCKNYYGQNELYFAKNKSEHLKKCGFKIQCDNCTDIISASPSLSESEEKLKSHTYLKNMVSYKNLIEEVFNSNEGCNMFYLKPSQRAKKR